MRFQRENGGIVKFNGSAVKTLLKYRQVKDFDTEAGGMLLGRLIIDCNDVIIDEVTIPFSSDKRSRFSFFRKKEQAQQLIEKKWQISNGTQIYLGEWHTHPEADPKPSVGIDIKNWHTIVKKARFEQNSLLFAILGMSKLRVWELSKVTNKLFQLSEK